MGEKVLFRWAAPKLAPAGLASPGIFNPTTAIICAFPAQAGLHLPWPAGSSDSIHPKMLPRLLPRPAPFIFAR